MEGDGVAPSAELFDARALPAPAATTWRRRRTSRRRGGCASPPARHAAYPARSPGRDGRRARTRGATRPRRRSRPRRRRGEAAAPAAYVSVTTGEDAGGRGFRRKGEAGSATPRAVDDDDAGDDADVRAALAAALAEAGLDAGRRGRRPAGDDDVVAFLETLFEAATEEDLDALMQALPDDDEEATAVATVGNGVPRLREMALEGAPRNSVELRDRQAAVLGLAEAAWAALLDDGLAPDAACLNAYYSVYSRALRRTRAAAIYDTFAERFPDRFPDARTARHAVELRCRLGTSRAPARCARRPTIRRRWARRSTRTRARGTCTAPASSARAWSGPTRPTRRRAGAPRPGPAVPRAVAEGASTRRGGRAARPSGFCATSGASAARAASRSPPTSAWTPCSGGGAATTSAGPRPGRGTPRGTGATRATNVIVVVCRIIFRRWCGAALAEVSFLGRGHLRVVGRRRRAAPLLDRPQAGVRQAQAHELQVRLEAPQREVHDRALQPRRVVGRRVRDLDVREHRPYWSSSVRSTTTAQRARAAGGEGPGAA